MMLKKQNKTKQKNDAQGKNIGNSSRVKSRHSWLKFYKTVQIGLCQWQDTDGSPMWLPSFWLVSVAMLIFPKNSEPDQLCSWDTDQNTTISQDSTKISFPTKRKHIITSAFSELLIVAGKLSGDIDSMTERKMLKFY